MKKDKNHRYDESVALRRHTSLPVLKPRDHAKGQTGVDTQNLDIRISRMTWAARMLARVECAIRLRQCSDIGAATRAFLGMVVSLNRY
jgi:hypothetical protein